MGYIRLDGSDKLLAILAPSARVLIADREFRAMRDVRVGTIDRRVTRVKCEGCPELSSHCSWQGNGKDDVIAKGRLRRVAKG